MTRKWDDGDGDDDDVSVSWVLESEPLSNRTKMFILSSLLNNNKISRSTTRIPTLTAMLSPCTKEEQK